MGGREGGTRWGHHRNGTRSAIPLCTYVGTYMYMIAHDFESRFQVPRSPSLTSPHLTSVLTSLPLHTAYCGSSAGLHGTPHGTYIASHHHNERLPGRHAYIAAVSLVSPNRWAERGCPPRALPCVLVVCQCQCQCSYHCRPPILSLCHSAHARPRLVVLPALSSSSPPRPLPSFATLLGGRCAAPRRFGFDLGTESTPLSPLPCRRPLLRHAASTCSNAG